MTFRLLCFLTLLFVFHAAMGQQIADTAFTYTPLNPKYATGKGSLVWIDEAHVNFHTLGGRYAPFGKVLQQDGYRVGSNTQTFDLERLQSCRILVISNALDSSNAGNWNLPNPSAFSVDEIKAVNQWVKKRRSSAPDCRPHAFCRGRRGTWTVVRYRVFELFCQRQPPPPPGAFFSLKMAACSPTPSRKASTR